MNKTYLFIFSLLLTACVMNERDGHLENAIFADQDHIEGIYLDSIWECRDRVYDEQVAVELGKMNLTIADFISDDMHEHPGETDSLITDHEDSVELNDVLNRLAEIYAAFIRLPGEDADSALYTRQGLNHRWEWNDNYVFIIEPSGRGYYYDFSNTSEGESVKPRDSFKCIRK